MPDLILRPRFVRTEGKPVTKYALQLRFHESLTTQRDRPETQEKHQ